MNVATTTRTVNVVAQHGGGGGSYYMFNRPPVIATTTSTTTPPAPRFVFNSDLRQGMSGNDVMELQIRLTEGVYSGPINGSFGPLTLAAVKAYQAKKGLPQSGFVGPLTRNALNAPPAMSVGQFINLLIQLGIIPSDKVALLRTILGL